MTALLIGLAVGLVCALVVMDAEYRANRGQDDDEYEAHVQSALALFVDPARNLHVVRGDR